MAKPRLNVVKTDATAATAVLTPRPSAIALVLFGRDEAGKPHAASFLDTDVDAAKAAGEAMALKCGAIETDAAREIAAKLPIGRLFPSGKAFVPFVKATVFQELLSTLGEPDDALSEAGGA